MLYDDLVGPKGSWLCHHGIKGQKWGEKNGPPYPLNSSQKSSSEKNSTGKNKSSKLNKILNADLITEENWSAEQKKQGKRGLDFDWNKSKRFKEATDLGLRALNRCGRDGFDESIGIQNYDREWFVIEDQTIGLLTIADLVNRGTPKNDILQMVNDSADINRTMSTESPNGVFQLAYNKYYEQNGWLDKFINACEEIKNN